MPKKAIKNTGSGDPDISAKNKLKILMVSTEASPFVTVGGAGAVMGNLSKALVTIGHRVAIFIPKFGLVDEQKFPLKMVYEGLKVPTGDDTVPFLVCNVKGLVTEDGVEAYFLENQEYYEKRANVYGYSDDPTRFALLSRGMLEFVKTGIFIPDVIHCNDWHTGVVPNYMKTAYKKDPIISKVASVFTIHNLAFQGTFDHKHVSELNHDDGKSPIAPLFSPTLNTQNFMRRGILFADAVNTVSKSYSKEILTHEFGEGLDKLLLELRGKLFGIINGLDYKIFDPMTDGLIPRNYDIKSIELRADNKKALQKEFGLETNPDILMLGFVGRLDNMKGVDLMIGVLYNIMRNFDVQFVEVGGGDWALTEMLQHLKADFPGRVGIHPYPNFTLPRLIFSGADCVLYPSRFEPCGIVQIESMRYGAIPIVRNVGGLSDTVENFDSGAKTGTGFVFNEFNEFALYGQIVRAIELYKNKPLWKNLQENAMKADYSWEYSAKEYVKLYKTSSILKTKRNPGEKTIEDLIG